MAVQSDQSDSSSSLVYRKLNTSPLASFPLISTLDNPLKNEDVAGINMINKPMVLLQSEDIVKGDVGFYQSDFLQNNLDNNRNIYSLKL